MLREFHFNVKKKGSSTKTTMSFIMMLKVCAQYLPANALYGSPPSHTVLHLLNHSNVLLTLSSTITGTFIFQFFSDSFSLL